MGRRLTLLALLAGCAPSETAPTQVFPWVYTPETGLQDYEQVRFETETWDPLVDLDMTALYAEKSLLHRKGAPVESLAHFDQMRAEIPPLGDGVRISFVGDVMYVGSNWSGFAAPVAGLVDGDLRVGNLETPTDPDQSTAPQALGVYAYNSPTSLLDGLPLDALQLTNNHAMDAGNSGIDATVREVEARGFAHTGVDTHPTLDVAGEKVALLAYTWGLNVRDVAPAHELFVVPFGHLDEIVDVSRVGDDIEAARAGGATLIVVLVHWGYEYEYYPDPHFLVLGREMIALGADAIVGEGPHVAQPVEICDVDRGVPAGIGSCAVETPEGRPRTAAIVPSLANFGPSASLVTLPTKEGLVVTLSLDPADGVTGMGWSAVGATTQEAGTTLAPVEDLRTTDADWEVEAERVDALLGTGWKRE